MPQSKPLSLSELENVKAIRSYGIKDLQRYIEKIKKNIHVFEEAIAKEKAEMKRVQDMMQVLQNDINTINKLTRHAQ